VGFKTRKEENTLDIMDNFTQPKSHGGLGFWNFRVFNQALLAKQACRLITKPDSLCARVLKAKYYPNRALHDTVFTANSSEFNMVLYF
jgi:hypothetical protein